ncbi:NADP-dependent oxidoreductase [Arsenophonus nasoniae]|uniref:Crotonyl-CoA reductase n=2 Tax=Arsenophonus nasoniae TaxID=638 RepID=A0A4P7KXE2_9GAMM|nr:NADP-dependent oxidoreductase [Arsenophonus nasoniae]QBY43320.1 Crotonyl-CoA reductase [Arsenophonus nasoniae]WGM07328.1 NADP-dependent oxidoreductase [Arsenophonus nasoniae]WGM12203.1 NADP-dependent oxidoreductase [Arsenophonus nasoniae]WGM16883.1 NADP-dependent oxidoreductase [Arsenophonus nasoniae]
MKGFVIDFNKKGVEKFMIGEVPDPVVKAGEVLIKVMAVPLSAWELDFIRNNDQLSLKEYIKGCNIYLGLEFSGVVLTDGKKFKKGDRVAGSIDFTKDEKAMAELVAANEDYLSILPESIKFTNGASLPIGSETAYKGLVELAKIKNGDNVLIIGANGGVGSYAVQIAKNAGAKVTAIGGPSAVPFLKELGADKIYSYREKSVFELNDSFDIIFDLAKVLKFEQAIHLLNNNGVFVNSNPQLDIDSEAQAKVSDKHVPYLFVAHGSSTILNQIIDKVTTGEIKPAVESVFSVEDYKTALKTLQENERFGKIVMDLSSF